MPRKRTRYGKCKTCGATFANGNKTVRCKRCARAQARKDAGPTGAELAAMMDRMIRFEHAPSWVRHPQPQD